MCKKDSSGPYDYDFTTHLITLAKENNINFAVDIYPLCMVLMSVPQEVLAMMLKVL